MPMLEMSLRISWRLVGAGNLPRAMDRGAHSIKISLKVVIGCQRPRAEGKEIGLLKKLYDNIAEVFFIPEVARSRLRFTDPVARCLGQRLRPALDRSASCRRHRGGHITGLQGAAGPT